MNPQTFRSRRLLVAVLIGAGMLLFPACQRTKATNTKRYSFTGRIISIDSQNKSAVIDGDAIPGYMDPMAMSYKIKPVEMLSQLAPGDSISADVVVVQPEGKAASEDAEPDYWLEKVKVTAHSKAAPKASAQHVPEPGDDVPDFQFVNQSGKKISLKDYRGKTLLVTFIYTRCPFPDFCPRISEKFAQVYKEMSSDPVLGAHAHLLSVSFDPEHDTPKILRDYGFSLAAPHDAKLFNHWEFAVPPAADLPRVAAFFGLTYNPENGVITHNLSTTVIGPEGKVVSWYHGGDWQVADLIASLNKDARAETSAPRS